MGYGNERRQPWLLLVAFAAGLLCVASVDVVFNGPLRQWDHRVMLGPGSVITKAGLWHWIWRTLVGAGQFYIVGPLAITAAGLEAIRRKSPRILITVALWAAFDQFAVWGLKLVFGRTYPSSGVDRLHTHLFDPAFPSGHSALSSSCLLVIAILLPTRAKKHAMPFALLLAALAATATVTLGYHWPTDAIAGWSYGVLLGLFGCWVVARHGHRNHVAVSATGVER